MNINVKEKEATWIPNKAYYTVQGFSHADFICSNCGQKKLLTPNYCPNCGYEIEKEEEDEGNSM